MIASVAAFKKHIAKLGGQTISAPIIPHAPSDHDALQGPQQERAFFRGVMGPALIIAILFVIAFALPAAHAQETRLHFATSLYPPNTTPAKDGYIDRIVTEAFARADIAFDYENTTAPRGLYGALAGEFDGYFAAPVLKAPALQPLVRVPEVVFSGKGGGVYLNDAVKITTVADFNSYRVGYIKGWKFVETLLADHPDIFAATSPDLLLEMLVQGRIDVAYMRFSQARELARQRGINDIRFSDYHVNNDLFIHLNPEHADLAPVLAAAIRSMKEDGTFQDIVATSEFGGPKE